MTDLVPIVAVPARNEAQRLPFLLSALGRQLPWSISSQRLLVVLVLNNTSDSSAAIVHMLAQSLTNIDLHLVDTEFPPELAHVGSARRLAMETALSIVCDKGAILTTDADAIPSNDWVHQNLIALHAGADIVGGRIIGDPEEEALLGPGFQRRAGKYALYAKLCDELAAVIDPVEYDPWPRHQDHTGGSIAVRSDVYRAVGGMPALAFREDLGFVRNVLHDGYRLVHPMEVSVTVSARTEGRAPGGMADCVKSWVADESKGKPILVECPDVVERRLLQRRTIRNRADTTPSTIAALLDVHAQADLDVVGTVLIDLAIQQVTSRLNELREQQHAA